MCSQSECYHLRRPEHIDSCSPYRRSWETVLEVCDWWGGRWKWHEVLKVSAVKEKGKNHISKVVVCQWYSLSSFPVPAIRCNQSTPFLYPHCSRRSSTPSRDGGAGHRGLGVMLILSRSRMLWRGSNGWVCSIHRARQDIIHPMIIPAMNQHLITEWHTSSFLFYPAIQNTYQFLHEAERRHLIWSYRILCTSREALWRILCNCVQGDQQVSKDHWCHYCLPSAHWKHPLQESVRMSLKLGNLEYLQENKGKSKVQLCL